MPGLCAGRRTYSNDVVNCVMQRFVCWADDGIKGVSHLKIDRKASLPEGTASFYFRTRAALLHAVAQRVAEQDLKVLAAATRAPAPAANGDSGISETSGLARLVARSATGPRRTRAKTRNELAMEATRDPALADVLRGYDERFFGLIREAVMRFWPEGSDPEARIVDEQAYAVMMFISGVLFSRTSGETRTRTAQQLDSLILGIVAGIGGVLGQSAPHGKRAPQTRSVQP